MTHETYQNLVRVQDKRIARARVTGRHSEMSEACEEKEKLAEQWRREQMADENESLRRENAMLRTAVNDHVIRMSEDATRLNSGTILLSVCGERVHYVAQDLRAAIDAGIAANVQDQTRPL